MINRKEVYRSRYLAGKVQRYHTWPTIHQQTVGQHCWRVACILVEVFGMPRAEVLYYCLHHDSGELWAGDVPFSVKSKVPMLKEAMDNAEAIGLQYLDLQLPELTKEERVQVKIADLLEMYETGEYEFSLGNRYAETISRDTMSAALIIAKEANMWQAINRWLINRGTANVSE